MTGRLPGIQSKWSYLPNLTIHQLTHAHCHPLKLSIERKVDHILSTLCASSSHYTCVRRLILDNLKELRIMKEEEHGKLAEARDMVSHAKGLINVEREKAKTVDWECYEEPSIKGQMKFGKDEECASAHGLGAYFEGKTDDTNKEHPQCALRFAADSAER